MQSQNDVFDHCAALLDATVLAEQDCSQENLAELEHEFENARRSSGVPASIRVRAKKLLLGQERKAKRAVHAESALQDVLARLQRVHAPKPDTHNRSRNTALRRLREDKLLQELSSGLQKAAHVGVPQSLIEKGRALEESVIAERREDEVAAQQLQQVLRVEGSCGDVEAELCVTCGTCELTGDGAQMALSKVKKRMQQLHVREQQQQTLNAKAAVVRATPDPYTIRELVHQARILDLELPPDLLPLLHSLDTTSTTTTTRRTTPTSTMSQCGKRKSPRLQAEGGEFAVRQLRVAERLCEMAEEAAEEADERLLGIVQAARQAMLRARQAGVPRRALVVLDQRITELERQHVPKLRCEGDLGRLLCVAKPLGNVVLRDAANLEGLRTVLREAQQVQADERLVALGSELLERSAGTVEARCKAKEALTWALSRPLRTNEDVELLLFAVEEARRVDICTLQARRKLAGARQLQQARKAAEVELEEAAAEQSRARLEDALRSAKSVGVSGEKVRMANAHLAGFTKHDKKCAAMAAKIRRAISSHLTHPWNLQLALREVEPLHPKTQELDRLIRHGRQLLEKSLESHTQRVEAQASLEQLIRTISDNCVDCADPVPELETQIERARISGVEDRDLCVAEQLLHAFRRHDSQLAAAEHRLRVAVGAKDADEISSALQQLQVLDEAGFKSRPSSRSISQARGDCLDQLPRTQLVKAATSTLRHLEQAASRKQAAGEKLLGQLAAGTDPAPLGVALDVDDNAVISALREDSKGWLEDTRDALQEAKQSGVAPSLIEQAKVMFLQRLREHREKHQMVMSLQEC